LRERYAWRQWPILDVKLLDEAARLILGRHDFAAFGTPPRPGSSSVRTIIKAEWRSQADELFFDVQADAFLYHMVRRLVFVQVTVGQGRFQPQVVADMLADNLSFVPAGLAPASGLTLVEVTYPENFR